MFDYINLTGHKVFVAHEFEYLPKGEAYINYFYTTTENGVCTEYEEDIVGLPDKREGVKYIVSPEVMRFMKGRSDLVTLPSSGLWRVLDTNGHGRVTSISVPFLVLIN